MADVTQTSTNESATTTTAATMSSSTRANKSTLTPSDKTSTMTADTMDVTVNTDPSTSAATSSSNLTDPSPADVGTGTNVAHLTTQSNSSQQDQSSSLPSSVDTDESKDRSEPEMLCNICNVDDCDEHNALVLCDKCDVCVHSECYGYPLNIKIPDDEWLCDRCEYNASDQLCALCPIKKGAMKRTTDWRWAHLSCALWIPEVFFRGPDGREPIDIMQIPSHRWGNRCCHCGDTHGAAMTCAHAGCNKTFHITCGMQHNIFLEYKTSKTGADVIVALCADHSKRWGKKKKS